MWLLHSSFKEVVANIFASTFPVGCPMFVTLQKLRVLKSCLKLWNSTVFGNVHKNQEVAHANLATIQQNIASAGPSKSNFDAEVSAKVVVLEAIRQQEAFWRDRARIKWLTDGDKCIAFFHCAYSKS